VVVKAWSQERCSTGRIIREWMVCRKLSGDVRLGEGTGRKDIGEARTLMFGGSGQVLPRKLFGACCTSIR
jgi:hypothetical protein